MHLDKDRNCISIPSTCNLLLSNHYNYGIKFGYLNDDDDVSIGTSSVSLALLELVRFVIASLTALNTPMMRLEFGAAMEVSLSPEKGI
jgi:hypothetical protein